MDKICEPGRCTGCGACRNVCGRQAICLQPNDLGAEIAVIDAARCVSCGLCRTVCPQNQTMELHPIGSCWAAWSTNTETRRTSASGGVAAELYAWAARSGMWFAGVKMQPDHSAAYCLTQDPGEIARFQNSKYLYADAGTVYQEAAAKLKAGQGVLFIGVPCQVDALRQVCRVLHAPTDQLYLADLVCHGGAPKTYLQQHVRALEKRYRCQASEVSFRDPAESTHAYVFTLRQDGRLFYKKRVDRNDTYQVGYHKGIIYRENCYACAYAQAARPGDLTLADFSYVGSVEPCAYSNENVSCVLCNTPKGEALLETLRTGGALSAEVRPREEETGHEEMLSHPRLRSQEQRDFVAQYRACGDFDTAVRAAARRRILRNELQYFLHVQQIRRAAGHILPKQWKQALRGKRR